MGIASSITFGTTLIILLLAYFMPLIPIGTESLRITAVFSSDETGIARILKYMINDKNLGEYYQKKAYKKAIKEFEIYLKLSSDVTPVNKEKAKLLKRIYNNKKL